MYIYIDGKLKIFTKITEEKIILITKLKMPPVQKRLKNIQGVNLNQGKLNEK